MIHPDATVDECMEEISALEAENARLQSDLDVMANAYSEISRIVNHQGTEEHSAVEDVRRIVAENARLITRRDSLAASLAKSEAENARLRAILKRISDERILYDAVGDFCDDVSKEISRELKAK